MTLLLWLHLVGAALWLGGLAMLALAVVAALRTLERQAARSFIRLAGWGFAGLSALAWLLIGISGLLLAQRQGWPAPVRIKTAVAVAVVLASVLHVLTGRRTWSRPALLASRALALLVFGGTLAIFWLGVQAAA
jgi:copper transport protein